MAKRLFPIFATSNGEDASGSSSSKRARNSALKVWSWNVAGLRAAVKKDGAKAIADCGADIVVLQETKCEEFPPEVQRLDMYPYKKLFVSKQKKGYSGVALLAREKPLKCKLGIGDPRFDDQGRLIHVEYETFHLLTAYVMNSSEGLKNLNTRMEYEDLIRQKLVELDAEKPVIYCGDLNVAHEEIDIHKPETNHRSAGFTDEERQKMTELLEAGFVDVWRRMNPEKQAFTYWGYRFNSRASNKGWRLDYFVISERIFENVEDCTIHNEVLGSDHCPLSLTIRI
ncbi:DNA-(apurinic or apyrimidinic site) lyase [Aphelenchoides fujianensis]|nr:DNA-(apurinic or apyrimidinic site) lyase [Aphelenchoides fujianensis]